MQNNLKKRKPSAIKRLVKNISPKTIVLANFFLFFISFFFIIFAISFYIDSLKYGVYTIYIYKDYLEHLILSLAISLSGCIIFDISIFEKNQKK